MNKFLVFILLILIIHLNSSSVPTDIEKKWLEWKLKNNKSYSNSTYVNRFHPIRNQSKKEELERFRIFKINMFKIIEHNNHSNKSYSMDTNAYSDLTLDELNTRFVAVIDVNQLKQFNMISNKTYYNKSKSIAKRIDWVKSGYVDKIHNQGACGACYTFATVSLFFIFKKHITFIKNTKICK